MASVNINTDALVSFTNRLEKMRKYDLPVVINQTLNDAAYDVKSVTMPQLVSSEFDQRNKTFFKSTSQYERSKGFNINSQRSIVGFKGKDTKAGAVRDLEQQERGGSIPQRDFIALNPARTSKSFNKNVKAKNRISNIQGIKKLKNT